MLERSKKIELPISLKNRLEDVAREIDGANPSLFNKVQNNWLEKDAEKSEKQMANKSKFQKLSKQSDCIDE
jgi:hypothetical protein